MYHFEGSISMNLNGVQTSYDLSLPNFIPRGCVVCNCEMYAVVVYTGVDTKIILN
jgi:magnesium-transporting ATPase (P-type)